jgi:hypothetical protein
LSESIQDIDLKGKVVVVTDGIYESSAVGPHRLFICESGFGCTPGARGTAVMGKFIQTDQSCRIERYEIEGLAAAEQQFEYDKAKDQNHHGTHVILSLSVLVPQAPGEATDAKALAEHVLDKKYPCQVKIASQRPLTDLAFELACQAHKMDPKTVFMPTSWSQMIEGRRAEAEYQYETENWDGEFEILTAYDWDYVVPPYVGDEFKAPNDEVNRTWTRTVFVMQEGAPGGAAYLLTIRFQPGGSSDVEELTFVPHPTKK